MVRWPISRRRSGSNVRRGGRSVPIRVTPAAGPWSASSYPFDALAPRATRRASGVSRRPPGKGEAAAAAAAVVSPARPPATRGGRGAQDEQDGTGVGALARSAGRTAVHLCRVQIRTAVRGAAACPMHLCTGAVLRHGLLRGPARVCSAGPAEERGSPHGPRPRSADRVSRRHRQARGRSHLWAPAGDGRRLQQCAGVAEWRRSGCKIGA